MVIESCSQRLLAVTLLTISGGRSQHCGFRLGHFPQPSGKLYAIDIR